MYKKTRSPFRTERCSKEQYNNQKKNYLLIFIFKIKSRFDSRDIGGFIYSDQFIQMSAILPTKYIYGLGEHRSSFILDSDWKTYTFFNHDSPPTNDVR